VNQTAARLDYQPEVIERSVGEQLTLNRSVVVAADDEGLRDHVHPARWERRGFLQRLRRRTGLSRIA
jgi:hypothetical protein